jgi:hypothetical protein
MLHVIKLFLWACTSQVEEGGGEVQSLFSPIPDAFQNFQFSPHSCDWHANKKEDVEVTSQTPLSSSHGCWMEMKKKKRTMNVVLHEDKRIEEENS